MATITVKNIPDNLYEEIKKKAKYHRRSLNKEIIFCLESAAGREPVDAESLIDQARHLRKKISFHISEKELSLLKKAGRP